jgi:hypothetical protein
MRPLSIVVVGIALLLILASACGDGHGTAQPELTPVANAAQPPPTSVPENTHDGQQEARSYVQSLCTEELVDWYVLGAEVAQAPPETLDEVVDTFDRIEGQANRIYNHVASVDPPEEMKQWQTSFLAGLQDALTLGRDLKAAVASGNENELAAVGERADRLVATFDSLGQMDVPAEYVQAWQEDCFPKIKERLPEAELP